MGRKVKTIKDFKFTLDNTVKKQVKNRNKPKLSSTLIIDFSNHDVKNYKRFSIHTSCDDHMDDFIGQFNEILNECDLDVDQSFLMYKKLPTFQVDESLEWYDMPEYDINHDLVACTTISLMIETIDVPMYNAFVHLFHTYFDQILWPTNSNFWYPNRPKELTTKTNKMYIGDDIQVKYPIYIISKGRYEKRYTSKYLEWCNVDYKIIVEPQEFEQYNQHIGKDKILILPDEYLGKNQASIPARNYAWWHAKESGALRHWILDDNITSYKRYYESEKIYIKSGLAFRVIEDYVDRYDNIKMAGHNYTAFCCSLNTSLPPITMNTRIYSSILLSNDIFPEIQWRGTFNEDTDLSIRILKLGHPTVLFNCILADKLKTLTQKGGNTDSIYKEKDSMYKKAASLQEQHPDVTSIIKRFGRTHHYVNYTSFKDLKLNRIVDVTKEPNNYGMILVDKDVSELYKN